jgi:hypothetical protein
MAGDVTLASRKTFPLARTCMVVVLAAGYAVESASKVLLQQQRLALQKALDSTRSQRSPRRREVLVLRMSQMGLTPSLATTCMSRLHLDGWCRFLSIESTSFCHRWQAITCRVCDDPWQGRSILEGQSRDPLRNGLTLSTTAWSLRPKSFQLI